MLKLPLVSLHHLPDRRAWCLLVGLVVPCCAHQGAPERGEPQQAPSAPLGATEESPQSAGEAQPEEASVDEKESATNYAPAPPPAAEPKKSSPQPAAAQAPALRPAKPRADAAGSPRRASSAPAESDSAPKMSEVQVAKALGPTGEDAEGLRAALVDFQQNYDLLSSGISCVDGCRALASMGRAASRICALATPSDLLDRCAAARQRLEASRRVLERRCGACL